MAGTQDYLLMYKLRFAVCLVFLSLSVAPVVAQSNNVFSVREFRAKGSGANDDTAAFQKALNAAGQGGRGSGLGAKFRLMSLALDDIV